VSRIFPPGFCEGLFDFLTDFLAILRNDEKRILGKRLPNCIKTIRSTLKPLRKRLCGIAVESTYNWYWLVDSLQDDGYKMHLANPF
jgi:transposase